MLRRVNGAAGWMSSVIPTDWQNKVGWLVQEPLIYSQYADLIIYCKFGFRLEPLLHKGTICHTANDQQRHVPLMSYQICKVI